MTLVNTNELNNSSLRFPGEFEPHEGTLMIWPERPGSWGKDSSKAEDAFAEIITKLLEVENVYLVVSDRAAETVYNRFNRSAEDSHEFLGERCRTDLCT